MKPLYALVIAFALAGCAGPYDPNCATVRGDANDINAIHALVSRRCNLTATEQATFDRWADEQRAQKERTERTAAAQYKKAHPNAIDPNTYAQRVDGCTTVMQIVMYASALSGSWSEAAVTDYLINRYAYPGGLATRFSASDENAVRGIVHRVFVDPAWGRDPKAVYRACMAPFPANV